MDRRPPAPPDRAAVTAQRAGTRLVFIDSLRGMAALYVLMFHLMFVSGLGALSPPWALRFLMNGGSGVTLFFIVSAFSLCHAHAEGFHASGSVVDFFIRRSARILPLFYVLLAFTLLHNAWFHVFPHSAGQIIRTTLLVFNLVPGDEDGIVPAAWSIGVEVMFYAVFPWLFPRVRSLPLLATALLLALALASLFHGVVFSLPYPAAMQSSYFSASLPRRLPVFLLGIGTWIVFRRFVADRPASALRGGALIGSSVCIYAAYIYGGLAIAWPEPYYWEAVVYAGLLIGLGVWPVWPAVSRATAFCGRISYSIYLLHVPAMMALAPVYDVIERWQVPGGVRLAVCLVLTLIILLPLAALSYTVVERPGMRAGKVLLAWRRRERGRRAAAV
jgi:peptidoglycan/LPS O-acetylase OafA/YrhL